MRLRDLTADDHVCIGQSFTVDLLLDVSMVRPNFAEEIFQLIDLPFLDLVAVIDDIPFVLQPERVRFIIGRPQFCVFLCLHGVQQVAPCEAALFQILIDAVQLALDLHAVAFVLLDGILGLQDLDHDVV